MTDLVPADQIEQIVGIQRHPYRHYARAVTAEQTVYGADIEPGTPGEPYPRWFCRATWEHHNVPAVDLAADTPDTIRAAS